MADVQVDTSNQQPIAKSNKCKANSITKLGKDAPTTTVDPKKLVKSEVAKPAEPKSAPAPKGPKVPRINKPTARSIIKDKTKLGYSNNVKLVKNPWKSTVFAQCEFLGIDISGLRYGYPYVKKTDKQGVAKGAATEPQVIMYGCFYSYLALLLDLAKRIMDHKITLEEYEILYSGLIKYFEIDSKQLDLHCFNNFKAANVVASCYDIIRKLETIEIDANSGLRDSKLVHDVLNGWVAGMEFEQGLQSFASRKALPGKPLRQTKPTKPKNKSGNKALQTHVFRRSGKPHKEDDNFADQYDSIDQLICTLYGANKDAPLKHAVLEHHIYGGDKGMHLIRYKNGGDVQISDEMKEFALKDYELNLAQPIDKLDGNTWGSDSANDIEVLVVPRRVVADANKRAEQRKKDKEGKVDGEDDIIKILDEAIAAEAKMDTTK